MMTVVLPSRGVAPGEGKALALTVTFVSLSDFAACEKHRSEKSPSGAAALVASLTLIPMELDESKELGFVALTAIADHTKETR